MSQIQFHDSLSWNFLWQFLEKFLFSFQYFASKSNESEWGDSRFSSQAAVIFPEYRRELILEDVWLDSLSCLENYLTVVHSVGVLSFSEINSDLLCFLFYWVLDVPVFFDLLKSQLKNHNSSQYFQQCYWKSLRNLIGKLWFCWFWESPYFLIVAKSWSFLLVHIIFETYFPSCSHLNDFYSLCSLQASAYLQPSIPPLKNLVWPEGWHN